MNNKQLIEQWLAEEEIAYIHGWDFSHIEGRYFEDTDFGWDYKAVIKQHLKADMKILDIDTGGGEFLLSLEHPYCNTSATEGFGPNVELCKKLLLPLGIDFKQADNCSRLPFSDGEFDIIINRHGSFDPNELHRILKNGGLFITQQVGEENERELVELLMPGTPKPFSGLNLTNQINIFKANGFEIIEGKEAFRPIKFFDVGALVWFARVIQWEFPDFSVETHCENLFKAQQLLEQHGSIDGTVHRYLIAAKKIL